MSNQNPTPSKLKDKGVSMSCTHNNTDYFPPTGETFCLGCAEILQASHNPKYIFERAKQSLYVRFVILLRVFGVAL